MNFKGTFFAPRLNLAAARVAIQKELRERLAEACFQYLDAVLAEVPVWSGASAATFTQLAKSIDFPLNITPTTKPGRGLGAAYGAAHGKGKLDSSKDGVALFTYSTTLIHLIWNEQFPPPGPGQRGTLKRPGPYHFRDAGKAAFEKVAKSAKLPNPFDTIKTRKIVVGR